MQCEFAHNYRFPVADFRVPRSLILRQQNATFYDNIMVSSNDIYDCNYEKSLLAFKTPSALSFIQNYNLISLAQLSKCLSIKTCPHLLCRYPPTAFGVPRSLILRQQNATFYDNIMVSSNDIYDCNYEKSLLAFKTPSALSFIQKYKPRLPPPPLLLKERFSKEDDTMPKTR